MDKFTKPQYYPSENQTYLQRTQVMIDAYYESDTVPISVEADTPSDDVDRLSLSLSAFPRCINEYVDKLLVAELSIHLPQDDIDDLSKKHEKKCEQAIENVKRAITSIETYAAMSHTPHLFRKEEIGEISAISAVSEDAILKLVVHVVTDMYGERNMSAEDYICNLTKERQKLDVTLLSLDYDT